MIGGLGTGMAFVVVTVLHPGVAISGLAWLAFGIGLYAWYRHRQGSICSRRSRWRSRGR